MASIEERERTVKWGRGTFHIIERFTGDPQDDDRKREEAINILMKVPLFKEEEKKIS